MDLDVGLDALVKAVTLEELTDATEKMAMTVSIHLRSQSQYEHQKSPQLFHRESLQF